MWFKLNGGNIFGPSLFGHIAHIWADLKHQPTSFFIQSFGKYNPSFIEIEAFQLVNCNRDGFIIHVCWGQN